MLEVRYYSLIPLLAILTLSIACNPGAGENLPSTRAPVTATESVLAATPTEAGGANGQPGTAVPATAIATPSASTAVTNAKIEIHSGTYAKTVSPGMKTTMLAGTGFIYTIVHYPALIPGDLRTQLHARLVKPMPANLEIEAKNPPTGDTLAFGVGGNVSGGSFEVEVSGATGIPPVHFGVQVTELAEITPADDRQTMTMNVPNRFLLNLGEDYDWSWSIDDPSVVSGAPGGATIPGSQGVFEARKPGQTQLTARGSPRCLREQPPCSLASRLFQINLDVLATGGA